MLTDTRKIHIIEAVLKTEDENILSEVERIVQPKTDKMKNTAAKNLFGIWSKEDATEIEKIIKEDCEQINPDDWK